MKPRQRPFASAKFAAVAGVAHSAASSATVAVFEPRVAGGVWAIAGATANRAAVRRVLEAHVGLVLPSRDWRPGETSGGARSVQRAARDGNLEAALGVA